MMCICTCNTNVCFYVHVILVGLLCTCNTNECLYVHVTLMGVYMYM